MRQTKVKNKMTFSKIFDLNFIFYLTGRGKCSWLRGRSCRRSTCPSAKGDPPSSARSPRPPCCSVPLSTSCYGKFKCSVAMQ